MFISIIYLRNQKRKKKEDKPKYNTIENPQKKNNKEKNKIKYLK